MENDEGIATKLWLEDYGMKHNSTEVDCAVFLQQQHHIKRKTQESIKQFCDLHKSNWESLLICAWGILLGRFATTENIKFDVGYYPDNKQTGLKASGPLIEKEIKLSSTTKFENLIQQLQKSESKTDQKNRYILLFKDKDNKQTSQTINPSQHPLCISSDKKDHSEITLHYSTNTFTKESAQSIIDYLDLIFDHLLIRNDIPISSWKLINPKDEKILHQQYSQPRYSFQHTANNEPFQIQFAKISKKYPERIAISGENEKISYAELDELSSQLATKLIESGVKTEDRICTLLNRGPNLIMAMIAIFKAGAVYIPINDKYPPEKISYVLDDSKSKYIITNDPNRIEGRFKGTIIEISESWPENKIQLNNFIMKQSSGHPTNTAYAIYTSGTTGNPKGVAIRHESLSNLINWYKNNFNISKDDRSLQFASQGFDSFFCEVLPFLAVGASIHIIDDHTKLSPPHFFEWIRKEQISIADLPTAYAKMLLNLDWPNDIHLKILKIGGESITTYPKKQYNFDIWNGYGPSETTVETTYYQLYKANSKPSAKFEKPPIGKPISGSKAYIVDKSLKLSPIGVAGELLIGGIGISSGYLNREELNQEKFIANLFDQNDPYPLYRTGDLARWLPDGNLEFIGRIDHQVKIRGYRIELDEIQKTLTKYSDVGEVVVITKENMDHEKSLIAYIEPNLNKNRFLYQERCLLYIGTNEYIEALSEDISKEGIAISGVSETLRRGQNISVMIRLPGSSETKTLDGKVTWQQENRTGVHFNLSPDEKKLLDNSIEFYIASHNVMEMVLSSSAKRSLKKALKSALPEYMIPPIFVTMLKFPLTYSGKIDLKSLPKPKAFSEELMDKKEQPHTNTEIKLHKIWEEVLNNKNIGINDNFFEIGGNSLSLAKLSIKILENFNITIPIKVLFDLPHIKLLSKYIDTSNQSKLSTSSISSEIENDETLDDNIIACNVKPKHIKKPEHILLTGASGFLGIYLLRDLIKNTSANIYCIVRTNEFESAAQRIMKMIQKYQLEAEINLDNKRIVVIQGNLSRDKFGLAEKQYDSLARKTDLIYHCAAQVNTMSSYKSLRGSNVQGTIEIIKFATTHTDKPINYVSTLSSAIRKNKNNELEEKFPTREFDQLYTGYAVSKWVSERLLTQLKFRGIPVKIYRSGYISGQSDTGLANLNDALIILIKGCIELGFAPKMNEKVTILPVDYVSKFIVMTGMLNPEKSAVYHVDHPTGIMWNDLVEWVNHYGYPLKSIPLKEWQAKLHNLPNDNALFPLIPQYLSMSDDYQSDNVNTDSASKIATTLHMQYPKIDDKLLTLYFDYLCKIDFFPKKKILKQKVTE